MGTAKGHMRGSPESDKKENAWQEFVVEAYQLFRARVAGADAVLLIAAVLPNSDLSYMLKTMAKLGLQALIEVHTVAGVAPVGFP